MEGVSEQTAPEFFSESGSSPPAACRRGHVLRPDHAEVYDYGGWCPKCQYDDTHTPEFLERRRLAVLSVRSRRAARVSREKRRLREASPAYREARRLRLSSPAARFYDLRSYARECGREMSVSPETHAALLSIDSCSYCGGPLNPTGHGLDRVDSSQGYGLDNVVPCCRSCNTAKNSKSVLLFLVERNAARLPGSANHARDLQEATR